MITAHDSEILERLAAEIRQQVADGLEFFDVERFMAGAPWSRRQTERLFRARYLTSPARYFRDCQWDRARELLMNGTDVLTAANQAGFASMGRLHDAVVTRIGMTPGELRRRGSGVHIKYGFYDTQIGIVLIAATARGVCAVRLCGLEADTDRFSEEVAAFRAEFSGATLEEDIHALQPYADQLVAYLEERSPSFCPPLDILQGTTFQREVWSQLQQTQPGETLTYTEIARRIGKPEAVRAVANACAANPLAIAIPCHRAVRSDGTLAGYRWGVEWKERLLEIEAERQRIAVQA
ncbi:MAG: methylated-DNA--[protein]-cysteine S-methyltransferase [Chloroflexi bacterium CFX4]|nr:methylated-DNA--[protein]-cysteine S-methyltransferase [Chloroflexi bacterium CFX4]MDL1922045.1 methylated-DNA--[protein]-cysteine S-methyltransferase [Chloroflexi bacterium CFX3]